MTANCPNCEAAIEFGGDAAERIRCKKCYARLRVSDAGLVDKSLDDWHEFLRVIGGRTPIRQFGRGLGLVILLFGGLVGTPTSWSRLESARATASWSTTTGMITRNEVAESGMSFFPDVAYAYTVGLSKFTGTQVTLHDSGAQKAENIQRELADLSPGLPALVYFDPSNPSSSVLRPGAHSNDYVPVLICALMLPAALFGFWLMWVAGSRERAARIYAPIRGVLDKMS